MSLLVLEQLTSDEFFFSAAGVSTPSALRRFLRISPEVAAVREALRQGGITEDSLRRFVSRLTEDFRRGERFVHELTLAALAVVLETRDNGFADEFLHDLAQLRLAEMSLCVRVARECVKHRQSVATTTAKTFKVGSRNGADELSAIPFVHSLSTSAQTRAHHLCGVT